MVKHLIEKHFECDGRQAYEIASLWDCFSTTSYAADKLGLLPEDNAKEEIGTLAYIRHVSYATMLNKIYDLMPSLAKPTDFHFAEWYTLQYWRENKEEIKKLL